MLLIFNYFLLELRLGYELEEILMLNGKEWDWMTIVLKINDKEAIKYKVDDVCFLVEGHSLKKRLKVFQIKILVEKILIEVPFRAYLFSSL